MLYQDDGYHTSCRRIRIRIRTDSDCCWPMRHNPLGLMQQATRFSFVHCHRIIAFLQTNFVGDPKRAMPRWRWARTGGNKRSFKCCVLCLIDQHTFDVDVAPANCAFSWIEVTGFQFLSSCCNVQEWESCAFVDCWVLALFNIICIIYQNPLQTHFRWTSDILKTNFRWTSDALQMNFRWDIMMHIFIK